MDEDKGMLLVFERVPHRLAHTTVNRWIPIRIVEPVESKAVSESSQAARNLRIVTVAENMLADRIDPETATPTVAQSL